MTVNEVLRDRVIEHRVMLERYTKGEIVEAVRLLGAANESLVAKIVAQGSLDQAGLQALLDEVRRAYASAVAELAARLETEGAALGESLLDWNASLLEGAPVKANLAMVTPQMLAAALETLPVAAGHALADLLEGLERRAIDDVSAAIRQGYIEGESVADIVRRVRGSVVRPARWVTVDGVRVLRPGVYSGGAMDTTTRGAERLVRTWTNHLANTAAHLTYEANSDLVAAEEWLATLDHRTCPICGALDGKSWPTDKAHGQPPAHVNCRCALSPVLKSWKELGLAAPIPEGGRASMDGEVPGATTYPDWLRRQSAELQDDILGPARGAMLRAGRPLEDMVDRGRILTLAELKARTGKGRAA